MPAPKSTFIHCPACKKRMPSDAGACPKCGHALTPEEREAAAALNRKMNIGCGVLVLLLVLTVLVSVLSGPSGPDLSKARAYTEIRVSDAGTGLRSRTEGVITLNDFSGAGRDILAQTAMQACLDLQKRTKADVVWVYLEQSAAIMGSGHALAIANYAPDGKGLYKDDWTWKVEAADAPIPPQEAETARLWAVLRSQFQVPDGTGGTMTDEPALKQAIARRLGLAVDKVGLPWVERKAYLEE